MFGIGTLFGVDQKDLQKQESDLEANRNKDYMPGGRVYQKILATQGKAAADKVYAQVLGHEAINTQDVNTTDAQLLNAGEEGLQEGADAELALANKVLQAPFKAAAAVAFKGIPWQVWLTLGVIAFFYLGGLRLLKPR